MHINFYDIWNSYTILDDSKLIDKIKKMSCNIIHHPIKEKYQNLKEYIWGAAGNKKALEQDEAQDELDKSEWKPYPNMTKSRPARSAATHSPERRARVELVMPCRRLLPPPPKLTDRRW
jgi:hypothetical protein